MPNASIDGAWEVVSTRGNRRGEIMANPTVMTVARVLEHRRRKMPVQCSVDLRNLNGNAVTTLTRPMLPPTTSVAGIKMAAAGQSVILVGFADSVASAIDLIAELDAGAGGKADPQGEEPVPTARAQLEDLRAKVMALDKRVERLESRK